MERPLLATVEDLEFAVGHAIDDDLREFAEWVLRAASARVRSYTGCDFDDPDRVPESIRVVVVAVAARVYRNPSGYVQDTTGPFTVRLAERAGDGIYLTGDERETLDRFRCRSRPALWNLPTTRGPVETGTVFRPMSGSASQDWWWGL